MKSLCFVSLLFALCAVSSCKKSGTASASDAAATTATAGPQIRVSGTQIEIDGQSKGTTRAIEDLGRMQKVDELFDHLKNEREAFKAKHPDTPFPGEVTLTVEPAISTLVFKSVFQTAAYAAYPFVSVDTGESRFVRVTAIVPAPPDAALPPRAALHLRLSEASGVSLDENRGLVVVSQRVVTSSPNDPALHERVKSAVLDLLLRRDLRANPALDVVVHADNRLPASTLFAAFRGVGDAHSRLAAPGDADGAFVLRLAVN
jgi:hypothetical protein